MSVNRYERHVLVLPEDDANRQLAIGFLLDSSLQAGHVQILPPAGGWMALLDLFKKTYVYSLDKYPSRYMVLLIDFDSDPNRLGDVELKIPQNLRDRVFIVGTLTNPEELKQANLGSYEAIGLALAKDCREDTSTIWQHSLLRHNANELARLRRHVRPFLFN